MYEFISLKYFLYFFYLGLNVDFVKESPTFAKLLPLVRIKLSIPNKIDSEQKLDKIN